MRHSSTWTFSVFVPAPPTKKRPCVTKLRDKLFHVLTKDQMSASGHLVYLMLFLFAFFLQFSKVLLLLLIMNNIFINVLMHWIWSRKEHQWYVHVLQIIPTIQKLKEMILVQWCILIDTLFIYLFIYKCKLSAKQIMQ